ncbi:type III secretion system cytoplasmic ring protein SctQ [Bradyrhizobium sp.]|uniref:type III secretion system cytoplasmic ring protein SctQ n=1 Tax=Bradyrhizobium sp. TaxID=376 RepID=UPI003C6EB6B6
MPAISLAESKALNAFYRSRPALACLLAGRSATIMASWPPEPDDICNGCRIDITVDGAPGRLIVPHSLIKALVSEHDPDQGIDHLDPCHLALVLELALADSLSTLEVGLGAQLTIVSVGKPGDRVNDSASLVFMIAVEGLGSSSVELRLPPGQATRLAQFLDRCAGGVVTEIELPVQVQFRVAVATCSVGEVATLLPGDVVTADHRCREERTAVAVLAEHLAAPVKLGAAGARLAAPPLRIRGSIWEWSMANGGDSSQADLKDTELDDIPVKLLFELGRVELSLAEVRRLTAGALIPVPRLLDESVDISANGRRIGRGSLVRVGDNLGVRITRLFHHG